MQKSSQITDLKKILVPQAEAGEMELGQAFVSTIVATIIIFIALSLLTILAGFAYWMLFLQ